ncbi:MAG: VOC family protein [Gammaproteobacteria bacterium]
MIETEPEMALTQLRISPHLIFDGQCREAFVSYQKVLGGQLTTLMTYGESPLAASVDAKWHARIVHATLAFNGAELNGADVLPQDYQRPQGFSVIVTFGDVERAREIFAALADGGNVRMPFQSTFWSPGFGVLADRFAVPWEINSSASGSGTHHSPTS